MNAYEFNTDGEIEYISGNTIIEALKMYCQTTGMDISEFEDDDDIRQLTDEELDTIIIKNTEFLEGVDDKEQWTLRELITDFSVPSILGGTAYI